jgi:tRNA(Ile)-lysidine synthase
MQTPQNPKQAADSLQLDRLAAGLKAAAGTGWQHRRYGVAVSGGPDSMALTWLMASLLPEQISAATVDHGFRKASADEARMVAGYCAREHIAHQILTPPAPIEGSLQAAARAERYRLLEEWRAREGLDFIVTAHHADDQLETLLMRVNRSSGVSGLAGVRRRNGTVLRPLLAWRRRELLDLALDEDIPFIEDPSNTDQRFDRARLRHALRGQQMIDAEAAAKSASYLADADEALDWATDAAIARWPHPSDISLVCDDGYPTEIFRRILTRRLHANEPELKLRGATLDSVMAAMNDGRRAMVGSLIIDPQRGSQTIWRISAAPSRKSAKKP